MQKSRAIAVAGATAAGTIAAVGAWAPGASSVSTARAAACAPVSNIEAVIDDSGSMAGTDINKLRVAGLNLLIDTQGNEQKTLGAVEFGDAADTVFAPGLIGPNALAMKGALKAKITADNGTTDYNGAFNLANADNPAAKARIFLTDGGHNAGDYLNGHLGGGKPPTYVIGFGSSTGGADGARLAQIASDTGGQYFPQTDSTTLQTVMNRIGAILNCLPVPAQYTDSFSKVGQTRSHSFSVSSKLKTLTLVLSWPDPNSRYDAKITSNGGKAVSAKLRVTRRRGATFVTVQAKGLKKGRFKFQVKAKRLGSSVASDRATTQVIKAQG
ncbi:MAG: VWA domain-containing protein [Actinomycetota bacterium]|nr:VWA domain-containing protein [Actinomycetota bacterium]